MSRIARLATALLAWTAIMAPASAFEPDIPAALVTEAEVLSIQIRQKLADKTPRGEGDDRAALAEFYNGRAGKPVWAGLDGLNQRARDAMAEIRRADDWGLKPSAFELPGDVAAAKEAVAIERIADAEIKLSLAVLKYARHARGGRFDPSDLTKYLDQSAQLYDPRSVLDSISETDAPGAYLRKLHPRHPQFEKLRQLYLQTRRAPDRGEAQMTPTAATVRLPQGPSLRAGQSHPHVSVLRQRLGVPAPAGQEAYFDDRLAEAVRAFQRQHGLEDTGVVNNALKTALNGGSGVVSTGSASKVLANMERWRYVPDDMGKVHLWVNVPEFLVRVVKDGKVVHTERIVAGKPDTQTVIFSAKMEEIIFHPYWNVPNSIKIKEIQPYLRSSTGIMERQGLRVKYNGREIDAGSVNWDSVDIRNFHFYQPPGGGNVLGIVKFSFPNKHDIYMHDTPSKSLFNSEMRTFSHGCMRVRDPKKLAEVLLSIDKGWDAAKINQLVAGPQDNRIPLSRKIPVHVTYFTAWVDESGKPTFRSDFYGHDGRMMAALDGKPVKLIAQDDPALAAARDVKRTQEAAIERRRRQQQYGGGGGFFSWLLN
jgi:murein L,D-transpeptidase YcbB/YkuD